MSPTAAIDLAESAGRHEPATVGVRELRQNASVVLRALEADHETRIVTVNGRPVAALVALDVFVDEQRGDRIERIGIDSGDFERAMARYPVDGHAASDAAEWLNDIRAADEADDVTDPWERDGR